jgi:hypothetical protein
LRIWESGDLGIWGFKNLRAAGSAAMQQLSTFRPRHRNS